MLSVHISETDRENLQYWRYNHPHPRVQQRMEVLWLRSITDSPETIAAFTNLTSATVRNYLHLYLDGGMDALKRVNWVGPTSTLEEHHATIEEELRQGADQK